MRTLVIAEAGVNHNGDLELARELVRIAYESGADIVKFQTFKAERLATRGAGKAAYQVQTTSTEETQFEMLKRLELPLEFHVELISLCGELGVEFLSTAFDPQSLEDLIQLGIKRIKIPSGELTNLLLLRKAAASGLPVILSTGMAYLNEIKLAVAALQQGGMALADITVLHCTSEYPAPVEMINLNAMKTISAEIGTMVGYSDHSEGIEIAIAAVALGANVIEKHFTIDRTMAGPDHLASLGPDDLKTMISAIRNVEVCLGHGSKVPALCEFENRDLVRKSIVAACNIRQGEILGEHNLAVKRQGTGISPMEWYRFIGLPSPRDFEADELIKI